MARTHQFLSADMGAEQHLLPLGEGILRIFAEKTVFLLIRCVRQTNTQVFLIFLLFLISGKKIR
jgi:hypothetical protein